MNIKDLCVERAEMKLQILSLQAQLLQFYQRDAIAELQAAQKERDEAAPQTAASGESK